MLWPLSISVTHAMKSFLSLVLVASSLFLAGCESLNERVRDRLAEVPPKTQAVDADAKTAYYAVQTAFKRLDFTLTRSSLASLRVEAASRIDRSVAFADSRQLVAQVQLTSLGDGKSEVALRLTEQVESQGMGGPSERPLREHGFYETYFPVLQQVLSEQKAAGAGAKN